MVNVNHPTPDDVVSRRVLVLAGAVGMLLLLAIGVFFALRDRTAPLWDTRRAPNRAPTP